MHKCEYGGKGLGKNEQGVIEAILAEGQHKKTFVIGFDASTLSTPPSTLEI